MGGGNLIIGVIIFVIIIIIQFIVINKGTERVSEVTARFTLDAMAGKQMAIDSDLNTGAITDKEAALRRKKLQQENSFFGSMDGATKFVKGDATAGLIITGINIIGGIAMGMLYGGMTINEALSKYTILTIGDGLSSQIPSLLISLATGILVTKASSEGELGDEMVGPAVLHGQGFADGWCGNGIFRSIYTTAVVCLHSDWRGTDYIQP